jgi:hypothetical protein
MFPLAICQMLNPQTLTNSNRVFYLNIAPLGESRSMNSHSIRPGRSWDEASACDHTNKCTWVYCLLLLCLGISSRRFTTSKFYFEKWLSAAES